MRAGRTAPLLVLGVALACGGRMNSGGVEGSGSSGNASSDEPNGGSSTVSKVGEGGKSTSRAGSGSTAGGALASGGKPSSGGRSGKGGTSAGGACACPELICPPGYVSTSSADDCCGKCVIDCPSVGCNEPDCQPGSHAQQRDDECCPSCAPDNALSCDQAREAYQDLRTQLIAKYQTLGCTIDGGCFHFWEDNRCNSTCGTPIPAGARDFIEEDLYNFAEQNCTSCPDPMPVPCARPFPPVCVNNTCQPGN